MNKAIKLKNGSKTYDRRLDRIEQMDPGSKVFPVKALVGEKPMRSYTWACADHLDQGEEGACVGFGCTHELIARPVPVTFKKGAQFAREKVYWRAQQIDEWPGGSYPNAFPKYEGTSVLAGVKVIKAQGWIKEYRWSFGLRDLILGVGYQGPAVLGLNWHEFMMETDAGGYIQARGDVVGGHCILCRGVDVRRACFRLHNSWGESWGVKGDCFISFRDMEFLLKVGGEACFFIGRKNPGTVY